MMNSLELFVEGHKELIKLVRWISTPMMYVERGMIDYDSLSNPIQGQIIEGAAKVGKGIEIIHSLPKEDTSLILKTFCESHLRLK